MLENTLRSKLIIRVDAGHPIKLKKNDAYVLRVDPEGRFDSGNFTPIALSQPSHVIVQDAVSARSLLERVGMPRAVIIESERAPEPVSVTLDVARLIKEFYSGLTDPTAFPPNWYFDIKTPNSELARISQIADYCRDLWIRNKLRNKGSKSRVTVATR